MEKLELPHGAYLYDKRIEPGGGHPWASHAALVFTLVVDGRLDETFAGGEQRCGAWQVHVKPGGAMHTTGCSSDGVRMLFLGLDQRVVAADDARTLQPAVVPAGVASARLLKLMADVVAHPNVTLAPASRALLDELRGPTTDPPDPGGSLPSWISEVPELLHDASRPPATLSELAAAFRVHPVYFARVFRRRYGCSVGDHARRARADRAVRLLLEGSLSLAQAAFELGYSDQCHLSREFKRETGWTPGRFRRTATALRRGRGLRSFKTN